MLKVIQQIALIIKIGRSLNVLSMVDRTQIILVINIEGVKVASKNLD
jgi:hypothetical protein